MSSRPGASLASNLLNKKVKQAQLEPETTERGDVAPVLSDGDVEEWHEGAFSDSDDEQGGLFGNVFAAEYERITIPYAFKLRSGGALNLSLEGVPAELGQTLKSTGLTVWRAAEHLCAYALENGHIFTNKLVSHSPPVHHASLT